MDNFNVIGDIAGEYKALAALLEKMPKIASPISLGDPNDRGPQSKEVIEFLMSNGQTVQSNHAHLMVEAWEQSAMPGAKPHYYEQDLWPLHNGGGPTMDSYAGTEPHHWGTLNKKIHEIIPAEHIKWLKECPMYIKSESFVFTHAPCHPNSTLEKASNLGGGFVHSFDYATEGSLLWNRYVGQKPNKHLKGLVNVFGHNSSDKVKFYTTQYPDGIKITSQDQLIELWSMRTDHPVYAICLDTSSAKVLTGLHLPTMMLYSQEYIR